MMPRVEKLDIKLFKKYAKKGDLLEEWQELVTRPRDLSIYKFAENFRNNRKNSDSNESEEWKEMRTFLQGIADYNVTMENEVLRQLKDRAVDQVGGNVKLNEVTSSGWGSMGKASYNVNRSKGTVDVNYERIITDDDETFLSFYLTSLKNQFDQMDEEMLIKRF